MIHIKNARLLSRGVELRETDLIVAEGRIVGLGAPETPADEVIDLEGCYLAPGFIDLQLNGGYERYFSYAPDATTLAEMTRACLEHATPYYYATLITSPLETIWQAIEAVREAMKHDKHLLGMHLEGPFINAKRRGAHNASFICSPTDSLLDEIIERGRGVIKVITIAPECFTPAQLDKLLASGIQVSIGHSEASYEQAMASFDRGVRIITHLYNAMSPMTHRAPGLVGAALEDARVYTPIILDGRHCHEGAARIAYRAKGDKLLLLTDAAVLGRRLSHIGWEGLNARLTEDGFYINEDGNLAGAAISMPEAVRHAVRYLDVSLAQAADMATGRVADALGCGHELGTLAPGFPSFFSVFTADLSHYQSLCFY